MIRDLGPYSSRNTSKGALIEETGQIIAALSSGLPLEEVRKRALEGNILKQRTRISRKRVWDLIHYRLLTHKTSWVLEDLKKTYLIKGRHSSDFITLLYLHYCLRDKLTFDFVTQIIWQSWNQRKLDISRNDILAFLDTLSEAQPQVARWTLSSRRKLAGSILTALRDFGLLKGSQKKKIHKPPLPLSTAEHLLHILISEGLRGKEPVDDPAWRLFLLSADEVSNVLSQLSQAKLIRFERSGHTVVLDTPANWSSLS
ncbi:MAG: hypothetical protein A3K30_02240 [Deltaproteobacteria bacterium RBG_13_51_10]|nr:MAG: hypothetical protein A3K30_02240 [Deltaproteobacteria bacterium RBG_13_51_10]